MEKAALRKQFHDAYKSILGRNKYNQNLRGYVYIPYNGTYYSDCSSSICAAMNKAGITMGLLNTAGMYQSNQWKEVPVKVGGGHVNASDIAKLRVGDALMFRGSDPSRPLQIGHVEAIYEINGPTENDIVICGHGSGVPSTKNMKAYCTMREGSRAANGKTKGLVCILRAIAEDGVKPTDTSPIGIGLIKQFEGLRLIAYQCSANVWTIGYGHTSGVKEGQQITQTQAEGFLKSDLKTFEDTVNKYVTAPINQNQFDALVSFAFNCGGSALKNSTLLKKLNTGDYIGAAKQFDVWNKAGGKILKGLVDRREAERELFLKGYSASSVNTGQTPTGSALDTWVKRLQIAINTICKPGIIVDGVAGPKTLAACPMLKKGSKNAVAGLLQEELNTLGFNCGNVDSSFGIKTETAVKSYQKSKGLAVDGIVGKQTWARLLGR